MSAKYPPQALARVSEKRGMRHLATVEWDGIGSPSKRALRYLRKTEVHNLPRAQGIVPEDLLVHILEANIANISVGRGLKGRARFVGL